ncbi:MULTISPECIES: acetyltransferase [Gammaproteobacteria]|uniref:Sugar O-acyltransferase, sialic acid O-acetyltransferase NeuD family protein n=1 Tax=Alteromonas macleodii (strain English Channel 673) TaxID=1004788 RepID=A0AB33A0N5_ALTME|nr:MULTISPECIES: acetyltransferase [Gammaproteobacteria]AGP94406.1 sugar O-acyltransferase, sialic acid O-acetyltransferase NeuD family protein [Alteromonas mediterranea U8]MBL3811347.1 acetyltransferase [Alteromonas macleodii]AFT75385.1 sugar O-acyltransferase, sialic acid O-acetyltransferase NeuD family protein [Alteromonas macleodii str. 'English Channel 673']AGP86450.1 sugar O-acyltransferase, sialic acid O-acetyltransferase NeuD family protein [Alteromonas mediterranea U4]AGP90589.1 sugar
MNNKKLAIIGAGGHGSVVYDCAKNSCEYESVFFLDSNYPRKKKHKGLPVVDTFENFISAPPPGIDYFVAIGDNQARKKLCETIIALQYPLVTLIHPQAVVSGDVKIGAGALIMPGSVINTGSTLGTGVIVNTCASVDHDNEISDFVHLAPGARLAGGVVVDDCSMVGIGAIVVQNIRIGSNAIVGAGATVIHDVEASAKVVGTPAKKIKS